VKWGRGGEEERRCVWGERVRSEGRLRNKVVVVFSSAIGNHDRLFRFSQESRRFRKLRNQERKIYLACNNKTLIIIFF
jgi:hypothetical protein